MTLNRFASDYLRKVKVFSQQRITKVKVKINIETKEVSNLIIVNTKTNKKYHVKNDVNINIIVIQCPGNKRTQFMWEKIECCPSWTRELLAAQSACTQDLSVSKWHIRP